MTDNDNSAQSLINEAMELGQVKVGKLEDQYMKDGKITPIFYILIDGLAYEANENIIKIEAQGKEYTIFAETGVYVEIGERTSGLGSTRGDKVIVFMIKRGEKTAKSCQKAYSNSDIITLEIDKHGNIDYKMEKIEYN